MEKVDGHQNLSGKEMYAADVQLISKYREFASKSIVTTSGIFPRKRNYFTRQQRYTIRRQAAPFSPC
jgi:hypothetical protein